MVRLVHGNRARIATLDFDTRGQKNTLAEKKIRVFELARELGMTNKEVLDLCDALGIGVKSHSSGIIEAQADRARRRAQ